MRTVRWRKRSLPCLAGIAALLLTCATDAADNLVPNPGFETPSKSRPGRPAHWSFENHYSGVTDKMKLTSSAHAGKGAVVIDKKSRYVGLKSAAFRIEPGKRYRVSTWVRIDTPKNFPAPHPEQSRFKGFHGDFTLKTFSAKGAADVIGQRNTTRLFLRYGPAGWRRYEHVFTTWPDAAYAVLYLRFNCESYAFYVDDVAVELAPPIPMRVEFSKPEDFLAISAEREEGYTQDVTVDAGGVTLARSPNLAPNASFERDTDGDGVPDGWAFSASEKDRTCGTDATPARVRDGKQSVKLSGGRNGYSELISDPIDVETLDAYTLSACYHFEGTGQPQFRLIGGDGQEHHQRDLFRLVAPYDWLRESLHLLPGHWQGEAGKTVRIALRLYGRGSLWFDGVVLRKGKDRGTVGEEESVARSGHIVSRIVEVGSVESVKLSWEGERVEMFARVGPGDVWNPRTWTQWRGVENGGAIFLPVQGIPMSMQWKARLRLGEDAEQVPVLRQVVVERVEHARPAREWVQVGRMRQGFIDPRDLQGGWKKYLGWRPEQLAERPGMLAYARDRAAGAHSEIDQMAQVRGRMLQQLVLYNAYLGAGRGLEGIEMISQGTGTGCGDVNGKYGNVLKRLGMQIRPMAMGALDGSGHSVLDVWSNEHSKWVFSDCFYGSCFITREGVPLSAEELFDLWQQDRMHEVEFTTWGAPYALMFRSEGHYSNGRQAPGPMRKRTCSLLGEFESYNFAGSSLNDHGKAPSLSFRRDGFPVRRINKRYGSPSATPADADSINFKINQTEILLKVTGRAKLAVSLRHNMPSFDHLEVRTDERAGWRNSDAEFSLPLSPGTNWLQARAVNALGAAGPPAEVSLRYGPAFAEAPAVAAQPSTSAQWTLPHRWRVELSVNAGLYERQDWVARCALNFAAWTDQQVNAKSLRMVEVTGAEPVDVPFEVSDGTLAFPLAGKSRILQRRRFCLYFDGNAIAQAQPPGKFERSSFPNWVPNGDFEEAPAAGAALAEFPLGAPRKAPQIELITDGAYEGHRCVRMRNTTGKTASFMGPFFKIEPSTPVEVTFSGRAPSTEGAIRVYLAPHDKDRRRLPWNTNKIIAQLKLRDSKPGQWRRGTMYGFTSPRAAWGRLRIDVTPPEVYLDDIAIRRRPVPESAPVRVEIGEIEAKRGGR